MNQQIIFNDDMSFDDEKKECSFTGLIAGERVTILIKAKDIVAFTNTVKFDFECQVEEWLENNEPPTNRKIELVYAQSNL
ncbi:MAG: hypothetical protein QMC62_08150 [Alteromonadaceae bacterium]|jgi:hypothetical protein